MESSKMMYNNSVHGVSKIQIKVSITLPIRLFSYSIYLFQLHINQILFDSQVRTYV